MTVSQTEADEFRDRWPELWAPLADARCGTAGIVQLEQPHEGMKAILEAGMEAMRLCDPSGRDDRAVLLAADVLATAVIQQAEHIGANSLVPRNGGRR